MREPLLQQEDPNKYKNFKMVYVFGVAVKEYRLDVVENHLQKPPLLRLREALEDS